MDLQKRNQRFDYDTSMYGHFVLQLQRDTSSLQVTNRLLNVFWSQGIWSISQFHQRAIQLICTHWKIKILHLWCKDSITKGTVNILSMDMLSLHKLIRAGQLRTAHSSEDPFAVQSLSTSRHHVLLPSAIEKTRQLNKYCNVIGSVFTEQITIQIRLIHKKLIWRIGTATIH